MRSLSTGAFRRSAGTFAINWPGIGIRQAENYETTGFNASISSVNNPFTGLRDCQNKFWPAIQPCKPGKF